MFYALKNNSDLYKGTVDQDGVLHQWELIHSEVDHILKTSNGEIISIVNNVLYDSEGTIIVGLAEGMEAVDVNRNMLHTRDRDGNYYLTIYMVEISQILNVKLNGRLIGHSMANDWCNRDDGIVSLIIVEEVNYQLIIRAGIINENDEVIEAYNRILDDIHQQSPWIDIVRLMNKDRIINQDGLMYSLISNGDGICAIDTVRIPVEIMATRTSCKNPLF